MLQNHRATGFIISEPIIENQQGVKILPAASILSLKNNVIDTYLEFDEHLSNCLLVVTYRNFMESYFTKLL